MYDLQFIEIPPYSTARFYKVETSKSEQLLSAQFKCSIRFHIQNGCFQHRRFLTSSNNFIYLGPHLHRCHKSSRDAVARTRNSGKNR
jgi:hypothetical protein